MRLWDRERMCSRGDAQKYGHTSVRVFVTVCVLTERKGVGLRDTEEDRKRSSWWYHYWG